jgi:hypothetical protein
VEAQARVSQKLVEEEEVLLKWMRRSIYKWSSKTSRWGCLSVPPVGPVRTGWTGGALSQEVEVLPKCLTGWTSADRLNRSGFSQKS